MITFAVTYFVLWVLEHKNPSFDAFTVAVILGASLLLAVIASIVASGFGIAAAGAFAFTLTYVVTAWLLLKHGLYISFKRAAGYGAVILVSNVIVHSSIFSAVTAIPQS